MKIVTFSDIHFGNKGNSDDFNQQCLDFLTYVQHWCDENILDDYITIFNGDYYHNRNSINVKTMNYGKDGLITISNMGVEQYLLIGNHDMYYKDRRDIHSILVPEEAQGINIIDEPVFLDKEKILLCPWLIDDETLTSLIQKYNPNYVFGHFEIPSFSLNKLVKFDGEYNPIDYEGPKRILSGHFHLREEKNNITYIGNCFSHDFSDNNEWHNKGFAVLDTKTNEIEYHEWKDAPKYCTCNLSKMNTIEFGNNMHLKLINDIDLSVMKVSEIKEQLSALPQVTECMIYPKEMSIESNIEDDKSIENIENIDTLIVELIKTLEMENVNPNDLIKIYFELGD